MGGFYPESRERFSNGSYTLYNTEASLKSSVKIVVPFTHVKNVDEECPVQECPVGERQKWSATVAVCTSLKAIQHGLIAFEH